MQNDIELTTISKGYSLLVRWSIVLALWTLLLSMAIGQTGVSNYLELLENREQLERVNLELALENQKFEDKMKLLENSPWAQLHFLKENFGYVEKDELVYRY